MDHKEMTKHIRQRIKKAGIKASVSKFTACGTFYVRVATAKAEQQFTLEEQTLIKRIAKGNALTGARCMEIEEEIPFGNEARFEFHG
jgi:hypothetical protein